MKKEFEEPLDRLPVWGPYSKKYMGISRVVEQAPIPGARFDCVVHPMLANSNQPVPNVTVPSAYHVWEAAPDLSCFTYRVELEWKDQVYADVSFSRVDDHTRLIRTEYVNHTDLDQNCVLNYYLAMEYPWKQMVQLSCEGNFSCKKLTEYDAIHFETPRPYEHLMPDGLHRGEFFDPLFLDGRGFGDRVRNFSPSRHVKTFVFGADEKDSVAVSIPAPEAFEELTLRYRTTGEEDAVFSLMLRTEDGAVLLSRRVVFSASQQLRMMTFPVQVPGGGSVQLELVSEGGGGIEFDFAALTHSGTPLKAEAAKPEFAPECVRTENGYLLRYAGVKDSIGFSAGNQNLRVRSIPTGCLEDALISRLSQGDPSFDHVTETFTSAFTEKHSDDGFYQNFIVHSIFIPAGGRHVEYALVGDGAVPAWTEEWAEEVYTRAHAGIHPMGYNADGKKYEFSNRMLQATLLTNVVYPIYRHGTWIKHHTPGKRWDSLYTWDSGFIGMGLLECEPKLAEYVLDLYLSREENEDFAFLMHGSPVPVQAYLYLELLHKGTDRAKLLSWYPRLKRYYEFLAGKREGSTTDPFVSRLTTTFDYFYNCSGMDDLPPQVAMYAQNKRTDCAPALTTSQLIRMAKILRMVAMEQGLTQDVQEYDADIALRAQALQTWAWDEESGYFGYVVHDAQKQPIGVFKNENGENYSRGMDGIYPLIAGICTPEQEKKLLGHIFSEKEMFSPVGISAVDMSASYYQPNGYWNGNVWFSHQWFIWKTMLDLGKTDEAFRIAKTALDSWKKEVDHSYYTFEMLNIPTSRGGWFHQFGGLSAPVNIWADAYYKPGTVTCGFDMWIESQVYRESDDTFELKVTNYGNRDGSMIAVTGAAHAGKAQCSLDGVPIPVVSRTDGAVEIRIPAGTRNGSIILKG